MLYIVCAAYKNALYTLSTEPHVHVQCTCTCLEHSVLWVRIPPRMAIEITDRFGYNFVASPPGPPSFRAIIPHMRDQRSYVDCAREPGNKWAFVYVQLSYMYMYMYLTSLLRTCSVVHMYMCIYIPVSRESRARLNVFLSPTKSGPSPSCSCHSYMHTYQSSRSLNINTTSYVQRIHVHQILETLNFCNWALPDNFADTLFTDGSYMYTCTCT